MDNREETSESTIPTPKEGDSDLSTTVKRAIEKIETAQLARARQEVAERLRDILDKVNLALSHARFEHQQVPKINFTPERKEREWLIDAITEFATGSSTKEEILKFILQWLSDSNQILIDEEDLEEDEEVEKRSAEWIEEVNVKVQTSLASSQACIDNLYKLSNTLFGLQHERIKPKSPGPAGKDTIWKWWREKKMDPKTLMHLLAMQPMSTTKMVEPNVEKQLDAAVGEIDMILTDIAKYLPCKKAQTIAFRYIRKFIENLHKAFHVRSLEYFEVENVLRKSDSFGSQDAEGNLVNELKHLQEHNRALKTRAELAECHYREARSANYNLENAIKLLRSKIVQLQNASKTLSSEKVTSEEISPSADLQVRPKQAPEIKKSKTLVKKSKDKINPVERFRGKCPFNEEHKNIHADGHDKPEKQRTILVESKEENIPIGEPEEQRTVLEIFKEENIPIGEPEEQRTVLEILKEENIPIGEPEEQRSVLEILKEENIPIGEPEEQRSVLEILKEENIPIGEPEEQKNIPIGEPEEQRSVLEIFKEKNIPIGEPEEQRSVLEIFKEKNIPIGEPEEQRSVLEIFKEKNIPIGEPEEQRSVLEIFKEKNIPIGEPEEQSSVLEIFKEKNIPIGEPEEQRSVLEIFKEKNIPIGEPEEQRSVLEIFKEKNIPIGEPEEQRTVLEIFKEENIPIGEPERENIPTEVSNGRITPTTQPKLEAILTEAVKGKMLKSDTNTTKKPRASAWKEEAVKTKAKQMAVDLLTDFQTAVLYSLDHGLSSGKELSPDDVCKVQALLKSAELKNLYGVIEKTIKEIFAKPVQKSKQEFSEQPIQVLKPSKEKQPELTSFAELLEEISRFSIIQEIALHELSAQIQYLIEEAKQDQSRSQQENGFHEKTLEALDTILTLEKKSSRAGMDQLIRIREATNNLYSINSVLGLKGKEMKLQAEHYKKEEVPLPNTAAETMERTIQPRENAFQAAAGEEIVDSSYIVNVTYLRTNYKTLDQAVYNGIISRQLHAIATHLIHQTLTTVQLRLAYLFRKYIAFRHIQTLRNNLNSRMSDVSDKDEEVAQDLYRFANRLEARVKTNMQHWDARQQLVNQSRQRHLNRMTDLFNQLNHRTGLHLFSPFLATKPPNARTRMQFRSPLQPTFFVTSKRPSYLRGQGNCTSSAFLRMRNSHTWSTNIVDGSVPIAKKDPAIPASFPGTPKLLTLDRKNSFRQMLAKTQIRIVGESLQIPPKSLSIPHESRVPLFADKNVTLAVTTSANKFNLFQQR
ncbi:flagellar attachment zone protein 1-like [Heptranchias perlo]|uniref:flagellar attachment zone protein 1-like n=1 Tax=Heptranchias perlo TaxID=212740 RepID=UPI003559B2F8